VAFFCSFSFENAACGNRWAVEIGFMYFIGYSNSGTLVKVLYGLSTIDLSPTSGILSCIQLLKPP
jgi:hypothetical protein